MSSNAGKREEGEPHLITMGPFSFSLPRSCRHCAQKEIVAAARAKKRRNHVAAWLMSQSNLSVCSQSLSRTEATGQPSTQGAGFRGKNDAPTSLTQCVWQVPCDFLKQSTAVPRRRCTRKPVHLRRAPGMRARSYRLGRGFPLTETVGSGKEPV